MYRVKNYGFKLRAGRSVEFSMIIGSALSIIHIWIDNDNLDEETAYDVQFFKTCERFLRFVIYVNLIMLVWEDASTFQKFSRIYKTIPCDLHPNDILCNDLCLKLAN